MEGFREMSQRELVGDTFTYTTLIQGFFQADDCDHAQMVFKKMESDGVPPSIVTYNILLDGLCKNWKLEKALAGNVEDGWDLFCTLNLKGVKPNVVTYTTMISGFCRKGLKNEAGALFNKMKEDGPLPNSDTYNTLIRAHLRDGDRAASAELIREMWSCGFVGDASTFGLVTDMLFDGRLDKSFLEMLS
ncbi:PREDICTED: pentatricopeptide repeat-containing protein At1g63070, mitochondrial-like [Camelina sativa]|uniref:Pentatricopeptide repeat-containing protein At1g63070, mitochondrial-like n=1 Tax=Camelina sativa TaxID=90675 RepID=A0ABM1Q8J7_CAMSA|nr:PREDICTED: pentatricopeptide repeat-containing protein At1g63070, mitochondrial-like [Camelina sativa]